MNPTVMQPKGLDFLTPIWEMIYSNKEIDRNSSDKTQGLNLPESDVSVTYTRYINSYKKTATNAQPNDTPIDVAIKDGFAPGEEFKNSSKTQK